MGILSDIQAGSRYTGDATLGGGVDKLLELDYRPIQQLAQYTYLYNKSQYDQRQKDADEKIKELSELAAYDLVNGIGKDAEEIKKAKLKLDEYARDYLSKIPANPKEKLDMKVDFDRKKAELLNIINAGAARNIAYMLRKNTILKNEEGLTAAGVDAQLKDLDNELNSTDIFTPISSAPKFKAPLTDVGDSKIKQVEVLKKDGNNIYTDKRTIWSPKENMSDATLLETGLSLPLLPKDATPIQKKEYEQRLLRGDTNTIWQQAGQLFNAALNDPNYKKTITTTDINVPGEPPVTKLTEEVDYNKIKTSNPIISGILDLITKHNQYIESVREQYNKGQFDNYDGTKSINIDEYQPIYPAQPLTGKQLIYLQKFAKAPADKLEKDARYTGEANTKKNIELDYKVAKQNADTAWYNAHKGETKGEPAKFMDLTGYTGQLTTADIAAIDPTLVVSENGVLKLTPEGQKATFKILDNGDVEVNYNDGKAAVPASKTVKTAIPEKKTTIKVVNKGKYQKESVTITQTVLKDRKGEEGNPFTFTGLGKDDGKSQTKSENYSWNGYDYSEPELMKFATEEKLSLEQYLKKYGIKKK